MPAPHLSATDLAGYLGGGGAPADRARIQAHLAQCAECRDDAVATTRILGAERRARAIRRAVVAAAAVAAVLVLVLVTRPAPTPIDQPTTRGLGSGASSEPQVRALSPIGGVPLGAGPTSFIWRSIPGALEYRLTVTDANGKVLWTRRAQDTTLTPPLEVPLGRGIAYYWFVDALLPGGRSVTSGAQEFHFGR